MSSKFSSDERQLTAAALAAKHAGAASAAIRYRFIARTGEGEDAPPMARVLRGSGGRGGATRLKLYISLLWLARGRDEPVFAYPAQQLATLLGLPAPESAGARRVQEAFRWLEKEGFVALDRRPGDATRVHLLDDAGSGNRYQDPGPLAKPHTKRSAKEREQHFYVRLPSKLWTEGWVAELSGAAIAMYLAALHEERGRAGETIWISPRIGYERYDLSDETRNKGLRELVDYDLLYLQRLPVPQTSFDERYRARNAYRIPPNGLSRTTRTRHGGLDDLFDPS
ncbi:hypothetical protein AB0J35_21705 [Nonomuraea angiospora]|uniref:hypothetical protein n=1 Tax=Nonomuraea angiospora TaxID=46172 RepID=UPI00344379B3